MLKYLYINGTLADIDKDTTIMLLDINQPFGSFFAVQAPKTNTIKLPKSKNNDLIFNDAYLPQTNLQFRYAAFEVTYIQNEVELITKGVCRISKSGNGGYDLNVYSNEKTLWDGVQNNTDGTEKTIQDLDFSDQDFLFTLPNRISIFKIQLADKNTRVFFLPHIDYEKDQIAPPLQRNLSYETIEGVNSWLQTFLAYKPLNFDSLIHYRSSSRYLFPAVKFHSILDKIATSQGFNFVYPDNLRTKWAVVPFCNEEIKLKPDFVQNRTVVLRCNTDETIIHGSSSTSTVNFTNVTDPAGIYNATLGYDMKALDANPARKVLTTLEITVEFMYYFKETGSQPHKLKFGWRQFDSPNAIDYVKEFELQPTFITAYNSTTSTEFDYRGAPKLFKETFEIDNYNYNAFQSINGSDDTLNDWRLIVRLQFHGTVIISASKTKITIKPKSTTKIMRNAVWGIGENLPPIKQSDFIKSFLQLNGLAVVPDLSNNTIIFQKLEENLTNGKETAIDLTDKLNTKEGFEFKPVLNTFAKNNEFSYKNDNTVLEEKTFNLQVLENEFGKSKQTIFQLPFAPTDDLPPSKGMGLFDFSDSITVGYVPICDEKGYITAKVEPRILLLNFFEGYGSPSAGEELGLDYEPPLFLDANLPQEINPEDPFIVPNGDLYDNLVTATFTNVNTAKYVFPPEEVKTLKIENIVETEYNKYIEIIPDTVVYSASFWLTANDYKVLQTNRIIKITKGFLEGFWYVNKKENFVDDTRTTSLELQKI